MTVPTSAPQEEIAARVKALEAIMIEKGIMTTEAIDRLAEIYENEVGPAAGRRGRRQGVDRPRVQGPAARRRHRGVRRAGHRRPAGRGHGRRREHRHRAQRDHLHAVLLLPVAGARAAAELVQGARPTASRIVREPRKVLREDFGSRRPRLGRGPRVGLLARRCATGCCPSARRAPRASTRRRSPRSSPATRMIGTGAVDGAPDGRSGPTPPSSGDARRRVEALVCDLPGGGDADRRSSTRGSCGRSRWPSRPTTTASTSGASSSSR